MAFFINETELTNYADDNTPYAINSSIELVMNADKSHLLLTKHHDNVSIVVDKEIIKASDKVKLLGVTIDNKLDFNEG